MTDSPACSHRRPARSRIWAAGSLGAGGEVEALEGGLFLEPGPADPLGQGDGFPAGDLVLAQDLQEVQVAEVSGGCLSEPGIEGVQHAPLSNGPGSIAMVT